MTQAVFESTSKAEVTDKYSVFLMRKKTLIHLYCLLAKKMKMLIRDTMYSKHDIKSKASAILQRSEV